MKIKLKKAANLGLALGLGVCTANIFSTKAADVMQITMGTYDVTIPSTISYNQGWTDGRNVWGVKVEVDETSAANAVAIRVNLTFPPGWQINHYTEPGKINLIDLSKDALLVSRGEGASLVWPDIVMFPATGSEGVLITGEFVVEAFDGYSPCTTAQLTRFSKFGPGYSDTLEPHMGASPDHGYRLINYDAAKLDQAVSAVLSHTMPNRAVQITILPNGWSIESVPSTRPGEYRAIFRISNDEFGIPFKWNTDYTGAEFDAVNGGEATEAILGQDEFIPRDATPIEPSYRFNYED